jgi:hypothetical protein
MTCNFFTSAASKRFTTLILTVLSLSLGGIAQATEPVYLNTPAGMQRLDRADLNRTYFMVAPYVDTQENMGFCGPASMAAVLNSMPNMPRPAATEYGPYKYFTQKALFNTEASQVKTYELVENGGMTLAEASRFLEALKVSNQPYYGSDLSAETLRSLVKEALANPHKRVIVDFYRPTFGQKGEGHYSPLVAYDTASDSVLITDVAKFKYPPFWVTIGDLLTSIQDIDPDSHKSRGLIVATEPE